MSSQGCLDVCFDSQLPQDRSNSVEFCTMDDNEDDNLMVPEFDEFDMWEQQQSATGGSAGESKETISAFQKLFLEELNKDSDVNAAAAKALQRFMVASPESSSSSTAAPESPVPDSPVVEFMTMCDDDEDNGEQYDLDEFDLWDHRQTATDGCRTQEQTEAISCFQRLFLDEAGKASGDINGAAADAIRKLLGARATASQSKPETVSAAPEQELQDDIKKKHAERFRALYLKELEKCGDANLAAAAALRKLNGSGSARQPNAPADASDARRQQALRAVRSMLTKEVGTQGVDVNQAVAAAILRIRKAQEASSKVTETEGPKSTHAGYGGQVAVRVGASS